jgi:MFS family permease
VPATRGVSEGAVVVSPAGRSALAARAISSLVTTRPVQLTLTGPLVGLALGQLLIGPLSDAIGRGAPLAGVGVHLHASLLCVITPSLVTLGVLRALQGLGAVAATVVAIAIVRDLFSGFAAAKLFSRPMVVVGVASILAPSWFIGRTDIDGESRRNRISPSPLVGRRQTSRPGC